MCFWNSLSKIWGRWRENEMAMKELGWLIMDLNVSTTTKVLEVIRCHPIVSQKGNSNRWVAN